MRRFALWVLLFFCVFSLQAQQNKAPQVSYYVYDENWKPCNMEQARYLACMEKLADTAYQWKYYNFTGPLLSVETFKDEESKIPHGYFAWFDSNGLIDSAGYTYQGKKDRWWYYFTDSLTVWQSEEYDKGRLLQRKDLEAIREERRQRDTIDLLPGDGEAEFKNGAKGWIRYLQNNLKFPDRAAVLRKEGLVKIFFVVNADGTLQGFDIRQSVEYSLDEEALRLVKNSPRWQPAIQLGKPVKAYRIQPFTFRLSE